MNQLREKIGEQTRNIDPYRHQNFNSEGIQSQTVAKLTLPDQSTSSTNFVPARISPGKKREQKKKKKNRESEKRKYLIVRHEGDRRRKKGVWLMKESVLRRVSGWW